MSKRSYTPNPTDPQTGLHYFKFSGKNWSSPIKYYLINESEWSWSEKLWEFQFGAVGTSHFLFWGDSLESGIEEVAGVLADHFPGHIISEDEMVDLYREAAEDLGHDWDRLVQHAKDTDDWNDSRIIATRESAEADLTYTESGWLTSYEWSAGEVTDPKIYKQALVESVRSNPDMVDEPYESYAEEYTKRLAAVNKQIKRTKNPRKRKKNPSKKSSARVISRYLKGL